jgi:hypothetical protein
MKARLLYRDRNFDWQAPLPWQAEEIVKDLELTTLFNVMSQDDQSILDVVEKVVLAGFERDLDTLRYRQEILRDCLARPTVVRELYDLAVEGVEQARKQHLGSILLRSPDWVLRGSIDHLERFFGVIDKLKKFTDSHADECTSEGLTVFFARLKEELGNNYVTSIKEHLERLKFHGGLVLSAELGSGNKGSRYLLHRPPLVRCTTWTERLLAWLKELFPGVAALFRRKTPDYSFTLDPRDESGVRALMEVRSRGIASAADTLAQSADHVRAFFRELRVELAFYVGCLNLHEQLSKKGEPICFPSPMAMGEQDLSFHGLYDICLALNVGHRVVGNDAAADGKGLVMITGANQGGKSTLLRSIGLAQLMMQCGMFVGGVSFCSSVCDNLFTHYQREEDRAMKSGKLDEELSRMSDIVDHVTPCSLILFNESFAATHEREGSEIARQIVSALVERGIRVVFVTHLYELARRFHEENRGNILFLRAEREPDGVRTFKLVAGEPLRTSFGEDVFKSVFGVGIGKEVQHEDE